jgi:tRNA-specific 2-thiouridylase
MYAVKKRNKNKTTYQPGNGRKRVLIALSGGVDSSVAAVLLKKKGYQVEAAFMRCWSEGPYCSVEQDQTDGGRVAAMLDIPFHIFDFEKEYKKWVIDYFFAEYESGRTPNPDVMCNKEIKFGLFLDKARKMGFDYIATGHYARVTNSVGYHLLTGKDESKDQSYFLFRIGQDQLAHVLFPLGELTKKEVRKLAKKFGLPTADKKDSVGICFVGPAEIKEFLMQKIKPRHGDIVSLSGKVLGQHIGLPFYTIGQREGLGISQTLPYYVAEKDMARNALIVVPIGHKGLFKKEFTAKDVHWVGGSPPRFPAKLQAKLRYRAQNIETTLSKVKNKGLKVILANPQRAITPGQSVVFYRDLQSLQPDGLRDLRSLRSSDLQGSEVVGGAVIDNVIN